MKRHERGDGSGLVAGHHVLGYALETQDRVRDQGSAPEAVVVFTEVVSGQDGASALRGCHRIGPANRRVGAIQVGGLYFHVADALFAGKPVLPGE